MATTNYTNGCAAPNNAANGASNHVVLFPFMAKFHTLPLLDFATALSMHQKSLRVTVVVTPANVAFARSRLPASVHLAVLPFPSLPPLPAGVESTDALPSPALYPAFLKATTLLREPLAEFMASLPSPPLVLVSDFFLGFTQRVAADAGVRRIVFHGMSCFSLAVCKSLMLSPPPSHEHGASFHVARMPEHVRVTMADVPDTIANIANPEHPVTRFMIDNIGDSDERSWGVLVNSFGMVDEDYVAPLMSFYRPEVRAWLVGPLFLAAGDMPEHEENVDPEGCLPWLDERAERSESVIYVSFGTQAYVPDKQLDELAHGLVQSGHPFLWAVRSGTWSPPVDVGPQGRIIRGGIIPQRSVLSHRALGGFLSHCGWSSVMESLAAGKPVLAWPLMAEQHLNAKHVTDIIGAGVRISAGGAVVDRTEVEEKVRRLMDAGEEGQKMRERATWARQEAKAAVSGGGTSHEALMKLVEELQRTG
ncbi:anthocyanin 3'-O-beta-glucosyltransferase-like [Lolium rigidum]|uniref:anthocyanin 3'-O-beta-glucosyltransferase-like n=1 Tax=Lolium rigidum TaxID=89674 RepID=UPI001F5C949B|nr:anthocyanin 3'-O-beta-glucosyltransferase-like [Lolium rigidum]